MHTYKEIYTHVHTHDTWIHLTKTHGWDQSQVNDYGYEDKYEMEAINISPGDYLTPTRKTMADFQKFWLSVGEESEMEIKIQFGHLRSGKTSAVEKLLSVLNMYKCEAPEDSQSGQVSSLHLIGKAVGCDIPVLIRARLVDSVHGILGKVRSINITVHTSIQIQVRGGDAILIDAISQTLRGL